MADKHDFCRVFLKGTRNEAKDRGIKIPAISSAYLGPDAYAVYLGDDWYDEYSACCAFHARSEAICDFMTGERSMLNRSSQ